MLGASQDLVRREKWIVASGAAGFLVRISLRPILFRGQTMFDRIANQFGVVVETEFLHEAHLVCTDGLCTEHQHLGDSVDALPAASRCSTWNSRSDRISCGAASPEWVSKTMTSINF